VIGLPPRHGFRPYYALGLLTPGIVAAAVSLVVLALALAFLRSREIISSRALGIGLLALAAVGLLYDQLGYRPIYHDDLKARSGKAAEHLAGMSRPGRVYADPELKDFFSNLLLPQGIDDLRYYDPLYPRTYVEFMAAVNELEGGALMAHYKSHMLFALEPGRVGHPLLALADVRAYLLSTRIDERPLMREWLSSALVINDRRESWLRHAEFVSGGGEKAGLMEHAPVLVRGEAPVRARATSQLLFAAAIPDDQVAPEGDGVQFIVQGSGAKKNSLLFSRFLDPGRANREAGWHPYALNLEGPELESGPDDDQTIAVSLVLLPGPRDNRLRDAAVWGRLRARSGERPGGIVLQNAESAPPYLYEDTNAYPRVWRVQGVGNAPADMDFMEAVKRVAAANPDAFRAVSVIPSHLVVSMEADEVEVAKPRLELKTLPGRLELESESASSGFLQIQVQRFPGWRAFARSGEQSGELRILPANGPFMALPAPAGAWNFELIYQPWAFRIGLWASLASLAATVAGCFWGAFKLRKGAGARAPG